MPRLNLLRKRALQERKLTALSSSSTSDGLVSNDLMAARTSTRRRWHEADIDFRRSRVAPIVKHGVCAFISCSPGPTLVCTGATRA